MGPGMSPAVSPTDSLATEVVVALFGLSGALATVGRGLCDKHGVSSPAAFNVMTLFDGEGGPLAPSVIAERMIVSRPTVTGLIDSLARRGHVRVVPHPSDGRMSLVVLTDVGRRLVRRMQPELHALEAQWMAGLSESEKRQLKGLVERLLACVPRMSEQIP